jgi:hypothetical protein
MREVEYDPLTQVTTTIQYNDDLTINVNQSQDLSKFTEYAAIRRQNEKPVNKERWNHYATIPAIVMHQMYQKGIDVSRDGKAVFKFINENYPALKLTSKRHDDNRVVRDPRIVVK